MNKDKYVFSQLTSNLDRSRFNDIVRKYQGDKYVKHFTCWNQLLALMFGQLSNRESLRDVVVALEAHQSKRYHLGMGREPIAKTAFATANQNRDYRIFEEFAFFMMEEARSKRVDDIFKLKGHVYAFDSTTIPLCLSVFFWAKFRKKKGGVKVHFLYDLEAQVPAYYHIKQHLKIKKFWGTTENAVRIQISAAIIAYCLVAIVQQSMRLERSTYEVLQILSISLTDKTPLQDLFEKTKINNVKDQIDSLIPGLFD